MKVRHKFKEENMSFRVFDAHEDIWTHIAQKNEKGETNIFDKYHLESHKAGNVQGGIFVIWIDGAYAKRPLDRLHMILKALKEESSKAQNFVIAKDKAQYDAALGAGKIGVIFGLEGLSYIENDLSVLEMLYENGARHASFTWNEENALATGARGSVDRGLTQLGARAVKFMEANKMLLDVSHLNDKSFWDIMKIKSTPIMASHSNARALCNHPRNLTDDQLKAIRDIGGVVGINAYPGFVGAHKSFEDLVDQTVYLVEKIGIDHVGCGFDFCDYLKSEGTAEVIEDFSSHSDVPNLFSVLKSKGFKDDALQKIAHENFERLLNQL